MLNAPADESAERQPDPRRPLIILHLMKTGGFSLLYQVMANVPRRATWGILDEGADELAQMSHYSSVEQLQAIDHGSRANLEVVVGHLPFAAVDVAGFDDPLIATVVRDPVDRVVSYLQMCRASNAEHHDLPLEQIFEDEHFGPRTILNHQTKMLGMTSEQATTAPPKAVAPPELIEALVAEGYFQSPEFAEAARGARFLTELVDTPLWWPVPVDRSSLDNARRNLERVEVLGIHDEYDAFLTQLGTVMGWTIDRTVRANRGQRSDISASFRRRIEEGNALDLELYDHARTLVRRT